MSNGYVRFALVIGIFFFTFSTSAQIPAFPGAEGFGASAKGGRGGEVLYVTNLRDSGEGSFRAACEASGPRIVMFKLGGTITLETSVKILDPYITIAGQSAPGGGICLRTKNDEIPLVMKTHDIVMRYIRIRPGSGVTAEGSENKDALSIKTEEAHDIIIDHCSITWGVDETVATYNGDPDKNVTNLTFQWNIIADALDCNSHPEGCHSKGLLLQNAEQVSMHHNLFANNGARNPMILSGEHDLVNNVTYNWGGSVVKIENRYGDVFMNYVKNYLIPGADSDMTENGIQVKTPGIHLFLKENIAEHVRPDNSFPEDAIVNFREPGTVVDTRYPFPSITTTSASQAYEEVLTDVGANLPARDTADKGTIDGVRNRTGRIIDNPSAVGGYPVLEEGVAPLDSDSDGMPDAWERAKGLNANDITDGPKDRNSDGYTNIEEYLNSLTETPSAPTTDCNGDVDGSAYVDDCENCVGGNTGNDACIPIEEIVFENCPASALEVGTTYTLLPTILPDNATDPSVNWSSSATAVASVASDGTVTTISPGSTIITATTADDRFTASCSIEVVDPNNEGSEENTLRIPIVTKKDDAEEGPNGTVDLNSSDIELVEDQDAQTIGLRFRNITIPKGATVTKAYIQFTTDEEKSGTTSLQIKGQQIGDAPIFRTIDTDISERATTDASVSWNPEAWESVGEARAAQRTPNLKTIVQEIINGTDWAPANAMAFIIRGSGERTAESYDGDRDKAAVLHITFKSPKNNSETNQDTAFVAETTENTDTRFFPNPAYDALNVSSSREMVKAVLFVGTTGKVAVTKDIDKESKAEIGISGLSSGYYLLQLRYANGEAEYHKVIIGSGTE